MNREFTDWVISKIETGDGNLRREFIEMLKNSPDMAKKSISGKVYKWQTAFSGETGKAIDVDLEDNAQNLFDAFKEHFADEMAVT